MSDTRKRPVVRPWLKAVLAFALLALLSLPAGAQSPLSLTEYLELIMEQQEGAVDADELLEQLERLADNNLNINDTAEVQNRGALLLNEVQMRNLKAYIRQNGALLSLNELYLINGFDSVDIARIQPFIEAGAIGGSRNETLGEMLRRGSHSLRAGGGRTLETAAGYRDSTYLGSPWRLYYRYQYHYRDRIDFSFSGEKDAGEELFGGTQRRGFDMYGIHLFLRDFGRMRCLAAGRYQLQFGQGLTLWTGFAPYNSDPMDACRRGQGIKTASAFSEAGYFQGVAGTVALTRHTELTLFYSDVERDATIGKNSITLYESGYHRSALELSKKDTLRERFAGFHIGYSNNGLSVGLTGHHVKYDTAIFPQARRYNSHAFRGKENSNIGVDARYLFRNTCVYGEAAASDTGLALTAGVQTAINHRHRASLSGRHYSECYHNLFASGSGQNSGTQNERGIRFNWYSALPFGTTLMATGDWFWFPDLKYRVYSPSNGSEYRVEARHDLRRYGRAGAGYRYKNFDRNAVTDGSVMEELSRHQAWLMCALTPGGGWTLTTKLQWVYLGCTVNDDQRGWMAYQEASWKIPYRPLSLWLRCTYFDVGGYDARIYAYESSLLYESGSNMLYGRGVRTYLMLRYESARHISLGIRYSGTEYLDRETVSSGHDKIDAPHKRAIHMQIYWKL